MREKRRSGNGKEGKLGKEDTMPSWRGAPFQKERKPASAPVESDGREAEKSGEFWWYPEQPDRHPASSWCSRIASQTLCPRESPMCPLCTGKRSSRRGLSRWGCFSQSDVDALVMKELHQLPPMGAPLPVSPQDWAIGRRSCRYFVELGGLDEGMEHRADAPRFRGLGPMPLTALP